eukprot:CAMPEP_0117682504 /NCGR_PEP_ID=MMETSP0804-20121206/19703_1 /TAXON_ID=1074897 /ORGANISM="Tetraselmis astigmatica, Strain CCMP880" /LENGTH=53 /DNA_ID=CAMNT_0005492637 /DNA_START=894 /DNA_END=1051 /DNA_ORIENTATION=+
MKDSAGLLAFRRVLRDAPAAVGPAQLQSPNGDVLSDGALTLEHANSPEPVHSV